MNLAPLRYRRVLSSRGGPIRSVDCGTTTVMGLRMFQANAFLGEDLRLRRTTNVIYGNPDGTGTALKPVVARHKAISEALERWAHESVSESAEGVRYGFDIDPSSNGMAAFPGIFPAQTRALAMAEAAERFALIGWWSGALDATMRGEVWPGVEAWELENPFTEHCVVVLHALAEPGVHAYGHGSAGNFDSACSRAAVELARSQYVLRRHSRRSRFGDPPAVRNMSERRCLHFASELGHAEFRHRLTVSKWRKAEPRVVFDGEVSGPWSDYACVWRVALEPASTRFFDSKVQFFFW